MALLLGPVVCSICEREIEENEEIVCFDHFLGDEHPLWRFSDSAMHKACFESWPHRDEFVALRQLAQDIYEQRPNDIPKGQVGDWYRKEAKRRGLG